MTNTRTRGRQLRELLLVAIAALTVTMAASCEVGADAYPFRFVYVTNYLEHDDDVRVLREMMERAAAAGYNGIVLRTNFDRIARQDPEFLERLRAVRQLQDDIGIVVVPQVFSSGYANVLLEHDPNLAAAVPVRDQRFVADGRWARLASDHAVSIANGGFEERGVDRVPGVRFQDRPGEATAIDEEVARSGRASLRFEDFDGAERRFARAMYEIAVRPFRCYRVSFWLKTELVDPGSFLAQVLVDGDRTLMIHVPTIARTSDWQRVDVGFNTLQYDAVRFYAGVWSGRDGRFWIDDLAIEEVGLTNVLRRPGTPVTVRGSAGQTYVEGEDYVAIVDPHLDYGFAHDGPAIELTPTTRIANGEELRVDYYQGLSFRRGQMGVCLSEPRTLELWAGIIDLLEEYLRPTHYFVGGDEIRHGGWCQACVARGIGMGEIIGTAFTRQFDLIRSRNPSAEVFIWADMLDPAANAHDDFYLTNGDIAGSWRHVPSELIAVVWEDGAKEASLRHFENLGMRTMASTYADRGNLDQLHLWLGELAKCEKGVGVMYTTWRDDFSKLEPFGGEINRARR